MFTLYLMNIFLSLLPRPPGSTLFPYTTLFRSRSERGGRCSRPYPQPSAFAPGLKRMGLVTPIRVSSRDRKSTRLNSSHITISYAVFCLKKKIHTTFAGEQLTYYV